MTRRSYTPAAHEHAAALTQRHDALEQRVLRRPLPEWRFPGGVVLAVLGGWLLFGGFALHYPYSVVGQNSELRDAGFAIVICLVSISVLTTRSVVGSVVALGCGVLLVLAGWFLPHATDRAVLNEIITGVLVILAAAATLDRP